MKKMKIAGLLFGKYAANTQTVIENFSGDLTECKKTDHVLTEAEINEIQRSFLTAIPDQCDSVFVNDLLSEGDVLDVADADVYVVYPFGGCTDIFFAALASKNRPILIMQCPYHTYWSYGAVFYPYFVRDNKKLCSYLEMANDVSVVKDDQELKAILKAYQVKFLMENTTALCIGEVMHEPFHSWNWGYMVIKKIQQKFGIKWQHISSEKFLEIFNTWDGVYEKGTMQREAAGDRSHLEKSPENAEKLYYVLNELTQEYGAKALTVNCLYSMIHTGIEGTACYALSKLNDTGVVAACEADVTTMVDMMITSFASGCPSFMLNPYLFPQDNKLFVSHCSSPTIYSYQESEKKDSFYLYNYYEMPEFGCGMQVLKKEGETVTITGISHDKLDKMIIMTGKIVRNTGFSSCRTQLEIELNGEIQQLAEEYQGRHWALVYGDHADEISRANAVLGIESVFI